MSFVVTFLSGSLRTSLIVLIILTPLFGQVAADEQPIPTAVRSQCYRDRTLATAIAQAQERLQARATADGVTLLQWVLDQPLDGFIETSAGLVSARMRAEQLLAAAALTQYRRQVGADSERLWSIAKIEANEADLLEIVQRFFLTDSGYAAAEQAIANWLDCGECDLAAALLDRVLREPAHAPRISVRLRRLAEVLKTSATWLDDVPGERASRSTVTNRSRVTVSEGRRKSTAADHLFASGWMLSGGDHDRNRVVVGSVPLLRPVWIVPVQPSRRRPEFEALLNNLESRQRDQDRPVCAASFPIAVRDKVFVRNTDEVAAINIVDGRKAWAFSCASNPMSLSDRNDAGGFQRGLGRQTSLPSSSVDFWFENSRAGMLTSDGRHVYVTAELPESTAEQEEAASPSELAMTAWNRTVRNRLLALYVDQPPSIDGRIAWINDGLMPQRSGSLTTRATFLGPPLPGTTELLCVTEQQGEIHLTSLDPRSGVMRWTQPVCVLDRTTLVDAERQRMACAPARSNGIVVFPTNTGLMAAIDLVRRRLLWVSLIDDEPDVLQQRQPRSYRAPTLGYAGFASHVVIAEGRVVYLPPRSSRVHCLDLMTGKSLWTCPRGDGEFVGNVVERRVLVVGRESCRSLALSDGSELWSSPTGQPAGRGLCLGDRYVLPLDGGRLTTLDLATGRNLGSTIPTSDVPLGHLIADGGQVYSLSHRHLIAFPQMHKVRAELDSSTASKRTQAERELTLAEIDLADGQMAEAKPKLRRALIGELSDSQRTRARRQLKLLLFANLNKSVSPQAADYELLERLIETPAERFQFLVARFHHVAPDARDRQLAEFVNGVYRLPNGLMCSSIDDAQWSMSPAVWNRLSKLRTERDESTTRQQQEWQVDALATTEAAEQKRFVRAFDDDVMARPVRASLAAKLLESGEAQSAETLWLRNRISVDPAAAAAAAVRLSELWERAGFLDEAAEQLDALATEFADVRLPDGATGAEYLARLAPERSARQAWQRSQRPAWEVSRVDIVATPSAPDFVQQSAFVEDALNATGRFVPERTGSFSRNVSKSPEQPCDFVFTPIEWGAENQQIVSVFDRRTSLPRGAIRLPMSQVWPTQGKTPSAGHLIPIGTSGGVIGLSTLQLGDGEPVWKQLPGDLKDRQSATVPGPSGPSFASFMSRNRLYVVDPMDGELLWQRTLSLNSQASTSNQRLEIVGDQFALAVQSPDRTTYEVFETSTGRALKTVRPGFDPRQWQAVFGRHIAGIVETPDGRQLQILDLLKGSPDVSEPVGDRVLKFPSGQNEFFGQGEFAIFGTSGGIKIFNVPLGQCRLDVSLDKPELASFGAFKVLADHDRYYINVQRQMPNAMTSNYNNPLMDSPLPGVPMRDDIYAFDRNRNRLLWRRSIPYRTVLQFPHSKVPFLVAISVVKDRQNTNQQSLTVEVLSGSTGETIGYRENLPIDRLLAADYDAITGRIILTGQTTNIELHFGRIIQQSAD
jgi:outer membrane protein assembly factor BamB